MATRRAISRTVNSFSGNSTRSFATRRWDVEPKISSSPEAGSTFGDSAIWTVFRSCGWNSVHLKPTARSRNISSPCPARPVGRAVSCRPRRGFWFESQPFHPRQRKGGRGPASRRVSVHATGIWPITGVKLPPAPFATIDRAGLMSTARIVLDPDLREGHPDMSPRARIVLDRHAEAALVHVDVRSDPGDRNDGGQPECEEYTSHTHPPRRSLGRRVR